jgi:hypothetical protein
MSNRPPYPSELRAADIPAHGEVPVLRYRDLETFLVSRSSIPGLYYVRPKHGGPHKRVEGIRELDRVVSSFS